MVGQFLNQNRFKICIFPIDIARQFSCLHYANYEKVNIQILTTSAGPNLIQKLNGVEIFLPTVKQKKMGFAFKQMDENHAQLQCCRGNRRINDQMANKNSTFIFIFTTDIFSQI